MEIEEDRYYAFVPRNLICTGIKNGNKLSMGARVLLVLLLSYRNLPKITISQSNFGNRLGVTRQMISKYLRELKIAGLITSKRTPSTCEIKFTSVVNLSIQRCKLLLTEGNNRIKYEKLINSSTKNIKSSNSINKTKQYDAFNF